MVVRLEKGSGCCRMCGLPVSSSCIRCRMCGLLISSSSRLLVHNYVVRIDAMLLTDVNVLLSGIVTDKDIATRVIAEGLRVEQTIISKIMKRSPLYVTADALAIEALQKMVQDNMLGLTSACNAFIWRFSTS